ncbi:hypothetical protein M5E89_10900 [Acidaminococcus intestini]|nr:hypothetical protein M5E89_10900 [Acidaminococcus intestini]
MPANSILIADDDEKLLSVLLSYFKDEQFTVYLARDGGSPQAPQGRSSRYHGP